MTKVRRFTTALVAAAALTTGRAAHAGAFRPVTAVPAADRIVPLGTLGSKLVYAHVVGGSANANVKVRVTDGTGDALLVDMGRGSPRRAGVVGGRLVFANESLALYATDGTPAGTVKIADTAPFFGALDRFEPVTASVAWFSRSTYDNARKLDAREVWRTDGTAAGTKRVATLAAEPDYGAPAFVQLGNRTLLSVTSDSYNTVDEGLWLSDGTTTTRLLTARVGPAQKCGAHAYFQNSQAPAGWWRTDGTVAGTVPVAATTGRSTAHCLGGTLLIEEHGARLRASTGGPAFEIGDDGTRNRMTFSALGHFQQAGAIAYFWSTLAQSAIATLYRTDGTAQGTFALAQVPLEDLGSGDGITTPSGQFLASFAGQWIVSDGTVAGTGATSSAASNLDPGSVAVGKSVYFWAKDDAHGAELWVTDGTATGTRVFDDIRPGAPSSKPSSGDVRMYAADGQIFVVANDGAGEQIRVARVAPSSIDEGGRGEAGAGAAPGAGEADGSSGAPSQGGPSTGERAPEDSASGGGCQSGGASSSRLPWGELSLVGLALLHRRSRRRAT